MSWISNAAKEIYDADEETFNLVSIEAVIRKHYQRDLSTASGTNCRHVRRIPYEPNSSLGDESDYQSRCLLCGRVLRDPPNRVGVVFDNKGRIVAADNQ